MDFAAVIENFPRLLGGFVLTLELTAISLAWGMALAIPLALMRVSRNPLLWMPAYGYVFFLRGTPLLIQMYLVYYGLGQIAWIKTTFLWDFFREAYWCALLAFSLNTAAYTAEILRGAIQAVPHGEIEAATACGMSRTLAFRRIILPRAFRLMLPAYSNEVVLMLQATSLASAVTLLDLTGVARIMVARYFEPYEFFLTIGAIYLAATYVIVWIFRLVEHRLSGHMRERSSLRQAKAALTTQATLPGQ
jgi:octopine/nopaline transport system permease protein/arginine/ornithine transport system permease protein